MINDSLPASHNQTQIRQTVKHQMQISHRPTVKADPETPDPILNSFTDANVWP